MTIDEIIKRLEAATEGSRELDAEIVVALDIRPDWCGKSGGELWIDQDSMAEPVVRLNVLDRRSRGDPPIGDYLRYTTSLDAALTLVPSGFQWAISAPDIEQEMSFRAEVDYSDSTWAASAPLALCIAALKARQSDKP